MKHFSRLRASAAVLFSVLRAARFLTGTCQNENPSAKSDYMSAKPQNVLNENGCY
jgi:hypothetical protein